MSPLGKLPSPSPDAEAHSVLVAQRIVAEIKLAQGAIPFVRYMDLALHAPGLGYYSAGLAKIGSAGDFVTAPEISPLYSRCIARQCQQIIESLGAGDILEIGAGSGVMASDILLELETLQTLPTHYYILEISADLRQRQRQLLSSRCAHLVDRISWLDSLPESFTGVVLANELLDAMPVHRIQFASNGSPTESYVDSLADGFIWQEGRLTTLAVAERIDDLVSAFGVAHFASGYTSEINLLAEGWIKSIAAILSQGMLLIIDYGFPRHEYYHADRSGGTLMCHYRHYAHSDPLVLVGLQDITAHIDFTAMAQAGLDAGLDVSGYTTQAYFLLAAGLDKMVSQSDPNDVRRHLTLTQQVKMLTSPSEMGELFKVMAFSRGLEIPLRGFSLIDHRSRL